MHLQLSGLVHGEGDVDDSDEHEADEDTRHLRERLWRELRHSVDGGDTNDGRGEPTHDAWRADGTADGGGHEVDGFDSRDADLRGELKHAPEARDVLAAVHHQHALRVGEESAEAVDAELLELHVNEGAPDGWFG